MERFIQNRRYASTDNTKQQDHYGALGVSSSATSKEIKGAYYKMSKKYHPDVNTNDTNAAKKFTTITEAYDTLSDPNKRREYDSHRYPTYDRTSPYAQRARGSRPAPPWASTARSSTTTSSTSTDQSNYSDFWTDYRSKINQNTNGSPKFGTYRGPLPRGRTSVYDFDEFYRQHYGNLRDRNNTTQQEQYRREWQERDQEFWKERTFKRSSKLLQGLIIGLFGIFFIFFTHLVHEQTFHKQDYSTENKDNQPLKLYIVVPDEPQKKS